MVKCLLGLELWLYPVVCEVCGWGRADPCRASAP